MKKYSGIADSVPTPIRRDLLKIQAQVKKELKKYKTKFVLKLEIKKG